MLTNFELPDSIEKIRGAESMVLDLRNTQFWLWLRIRGVLKHLNLIAKVEANLLVLHYAVPGIRHYARNRR